MEFSQIETLIMTYSPLVVTIIGIIISFIKMVGAMKAVKKENQDQYDDLKNQYSKVLQDNASLKKSLKELLEEIDHINRGGE